MEAGSVRAAPLDPAIDRRFRTIYESAPIGIVTLDPLGRVLQANPAFEQLLGYTTEELRHLAASELIHPDDLAEGLRLFEELRAGRRERYSREARNYRRDRRLIWLRTTVAAVRDAAGQLRYSVSMVEDITERKRAEEALRERVRQEALGADIGVAVTERGSLREILQHCAEALVRHLDVAFARIWTLDDEGQVLELRASAGLYTDLDGAHARVPVGRFKIGLIAQERRPHLTNH